MVLWRLGVLILWPFTRGVLRGRRIGLGRVPTSGATLVVCNHLSNLDPPLVGVMAPVSYTHLTLPTNREV